jgi:hypothetical protein
MRKIPGTRGISRPPIRRRSKAFVAVASVVGALVPVVLIAAAPSANAAIPNGIGFTQEGCNNPGGLVLPIAGKFICPDADYTTGNLGKNWAELDLVPFRVTVSASNSAAASSTFSFAVAVDNTNSGKTGFDVLSAPVLNTALSDASCSAATVGPQVTANGQLLRSVTITIQKNTDCVYDYYARLAIGAHLWPGSSLHANLADDTTGSTSGIGTKAVSINPNEIAPQQITKDMTATQDSDHIWDVTKSPSPASLDFTNTCDPVGSPLSQTVDITVSWTKHAASPSGVITVLTHVYATNPASRDLTVNVSDQIYTGTTAIGSPSTAGPIVVPHNTANVLLLTHMTTVPSGTTNLNDIATATYTDTVTGVPIPGTVTGTASATVQPGSELDASAVINDVESISGSGLTFSVDSVTGASGAFDGGYTAGTHTTGPVSWTSASQSGTGSVTFHKTVYASAATVVTGSLDDTATLTGSDGFTTSDDASVDVSTEASTSLNVSKTTSLKIASAQTFTFHLFDGATNTATGDIATVNMPANSNGPVSSNTITGLSPTGTYYFKEDAQAPYPAQTTSSVTFSLVAGNASSCSATINVSNQSPPTTAQVQKITNPTSSGNWTFTLTGPGGLSETLTNVQANNGYVAFASVLDSDGGTYTITETQQSGYDLTNVVGDVGGNSGRVTVDATARTCSFTLDLTTDSGHTFECTFTNTARGTIIVKKVTNPTGASGSFTFTGDAAGSIGDGGTITVSNLAPGTYTSTESDPTPAFDLTNISCDDANSSGVVGTRTATFHLDPGETVTCTFTNTERGHVKVIKTVKGNAPSGSQSFTFQLRSGASASQAGTILESLTANAGNGGVLNFTTSLVPGQTYQLCEQLQPGWATNLGPPTFTVFSPSGDNSIVCTNFTVTAGQLKVFNIDNTPPPGGTALTIGYWKNWSSCTAGKQKPVLDQKLLAAANAGNPFTLGLLVLDPNVLGKATACRDAVRILSKSTISSGTKKASDPLFNMAAQLLAADLNVFSGAATCAAATSAINQAHALLLKYNFDGNTHTKLSASDVNLAHTLASKLDQYNNNLLC